MNRRHVLSLIPAIGVSGCLGLLRDPPERPQVRVVTEEVAGTSIPVTGIESIGTDGVTVTTTIAVDNSANENAGGSVSGVEYRVFWGRNETGPWNELGPGEMGAFNLPAGEIVRQDAETTFTDAATISEFAGYVATGQTAYLRITGIVMVDIESLSVGIDFERIKQVSR